MPVDLASLILDVPDFPKPGVGFKDITPLLASPEGLATAIDQLSWRPRPRSTWCSGGVPRVIFAAPVAYGLEVGFVPVRKPGKLPRDVVSVRYDLEYGSDELAVHADAVPAGSRVLIIDDVLATGGTVAATADLVTQFGAEVAGVLVVAELAFLNPRPGWPPTG